MTIRAPYNHVPLNEKVFLPDWAHMVSHDIPFSDGESGNIKIRLTAMSPVYVRNGGDWTRDNEQRNTLADYVSFSRFDGRFFVPGTSIKGMIRNVLEIMSLGRMGGRINEKDRFSYRNLGDSDYRRKITDDRNGVYWPRAEAGWLKEEDDGTWSITPCEFARVDFSDLENFAKGLDLGAEQSAAEKYNNWQGIVGSLDIRFDFFRDEDGNIKETHPHSCGGNPCNLGYKKAVNIGSGAQTGSLVFTGQPRNSRKHMEFIFYNNASSTIEVPDENKEDFIFIHSDSNGKPNEAFDFWIRSGKLKSGKMPIFFIREKGSGNLKSMGLALMYRLPYPNRVGDLLPDEHKSSERDLADLMFGFIGDGAIKGRVHFSHAFAEEGAREIDTLTRVLGSPKASYEPTYLQGNGNRNGSYKASNSRLKGWKRYPVHSRRNNTVAGDEGTESTQTRFRPLEAGTSFICTIRFHNLRKAEIGALLAALTFYGKEDRLFHSLGMAKPLGCGKIQLHVLEIKSSAVDQGVNMENKDEYMRSFSETVEQFMGNGFVWRYQPQIDELLTMAHEQQNRDSSRLEYMRLDPAAGINEFQTARDSGERLDYYSQLDNIQLVSLKTLEDWVHEIEAKLARKDVNGVLQMPRTRLFHDALAQVLVEMDYNNSLNDLYNIVQYYPEIILKRAQCGKLHGRELKRCVENIHDPDKSSRAIQELFDWLITNDDRVTPDDIPAWAEPLAYGWGDLADRLDDDTCMKIVEMVENREWLWPPVNSLNDCHAEELNNAKEWLDEWL